MDSLEILRRHPKKTKENNLSKILWSQEKSNSSMLKSPRNLWRVLESKVQIQKII